jgi:hypothetical protein
MSRMPGISISLIQLIIIGVPQGFLLVGWVYVSTKTKFDIKKYLILSLIFTLATYFIRFLPIAVGVNTMLSMLILILAFQLVYRFNLQKIIKLIISVIGVILVITASELLNGILLNVIFGQAKAQELINSSSPLTKSLSFIPSNVVFAVALLVLYMVFSKMGKNKRSRNGKASEKTGE